MTFAAFLKGDVLEAILSEQPDGGGPNGIWSSDVFPVVPFEGAAAAIAERTARRRSSRRWIAVARVSERRTAPTAARRPEFRSGLCR